MLLPFLLLGASLRTQDPPPIVRTVAWLNLAAFVVGAMEFTFGLRAFVPENYTTEIVYRSRDLLDNTAYRIPASFVTAHVYAGTMVTTIPLLLGGLVALDLRRFDRTLLTLALAAALLGVFLSAVRSHVVVLAVIMALAVFSIRLGSRHWLRWVMVLGLTGVVVANEARLQRFTTLADTEFVTERVSQSVNANFFDLLADYPLGRGLAGGGTSLPDQISGRVRGLDPSVGMLLENEYARMLLELGIPGLLVWGMFIIWVLVRYPTDRSDPWYLGKRLAWAGVLIQFAMAATGVGLLTAIPQTCLWLLAIGWVTGEKRQPAWVSEPGGPAAQMRVQPARGAV
jgi:hypothetical protein